LKRIPDYFGGPKGGAQDTETEIRIIQETIPQMEALISGEVDLIRSGCVNPEQVPFLKQADQVKILSTHIVAGLFSGDGCSRAKRSDPFYDKKVRQAVNHAINREKIIKNAFNGFADIAGQRREPNALRL
jgi:peptide/nickel transport system substrate-binding protein